MLRQQAGEPPPLGWAAELGSCLFRARHEVVGVRTPQHFGLIALVQPLGGVLAEWLEQPIACGHTISPHDENERLRNQAGKKVQHVSGLDARAGAHRFGRLNCEATHEHRQPIEQELLVRRQQTVAPVERGTQRSMPWGRTRRSGCQQTQLVVEPFGNLLEGQDCQPRRRKFDR